LAQAAELLAELSGEYSRHPFQIMKLGEATRVFEQVRQAMVNQEIIKLSCVGDGYHTRGDIMKAINLVVANEYWQRNFTGKHLDEWQEYLTVMRGSIQTVERIIIPDEHFIDLAHYDQSSVEYRRAKLKMSLAASEMALSGGDDTYKAELPASPPFSEFLTTLDVQKVDQYWSAVYVRLKLRLPENEPRRFNPDNEARQDSILSREARIRIAVESHNSAFPLPPEQASEASAKRNAELKKGIFDYVKLMICAVLAGMLLSRCLVGH